jgi:phenylalanyl-tRNA synthetase beta chain
MKTTYNWLKDFVEIKLSPEALADKLTMAGLEVTSLEERDGDFVFEIEVTSNRPDCLSVIGVAREVAAITHKKLRTPNSELRTPKSNSLPFKIDIENKKDCPLYTARIISNVKVGPSPDWLRKRLESVGCRSVNNIVDITNYVLFTWGEPLHAFDLDKLKSPAVFVRRAKPGEKITTIDAQPRALNEEILVIADSARPIAIAGVMGGQDTEVVWGTKNILLEAAVFNPVLVRRVRQALGVTSESSYRFERGVDSGAVEKAAQQAVRLMQGLAGGKCLAQKVVGSGKAKAKTISLKSETVGKILGLKIAPPQIKKILNSLGFGVKGKNNFSLEVPSHRPDVDSEIDLIEEIARVRGYESIPTTTSRITPQASCAETRPLVSFTKDILVALGLNEVITHSLISRGSLKGLDVNPGEIIEILNPLSREQEILRPTLLPGLIKCIAYNLNQKQERVDIFEIARVFSRAEGSGPKEGLSLGIALCGMKARLSEEGRIKEEASPLHLKGAIEALFERLGIEDYNFLPDNQGNLCVSVAREKIGAIIKLPGSVLDDFEIKNKQVFAAELCLDKAFAHARAKKRFRGLPRYPGISRDISLIISEGIPVKELMQAIREKAGPLLCEAEVTDYYKGKQIPHRHRGLTISCLYRSEERTLAEAEINPLHSALLAVLQERFGAKIR